MGLALAASAAIEPKQEAEHKAAANGDATAAEAAPGEKKHGKRGLFDLGYGYGGLYDGFGAYGWGGPEFTKTVVVDRPVHYPVKVHVPVDRPVPVFVDRKVPVPVHIDRPVPYPVKVPVYHKVPVAVPVPKPYPVHVPHPVIVEKHIPHVISHQAFGFGGHQFSNGWIGHHGFGHGLSRSYSDYSLHH